MCKLIAELAKADGRVVKEIIARLESRSQNPGIDVRLTGEIYGAAHMKARALGLDPHDTTPKELYQALLGLVRLHDSFIARRFGIEHTDSNSAKISQMTSVVGRINTPKDSWSIRSVAAKKLLKTNPPKTLQKLLNYQSLDSMLRRENPGQLITAARYTESFGWQNKLQANYKKLTPMDFESSRANIQFVGSKKWQKAAEVIAKKAEASIITNFETGTILTLPVGGRIREGLTLMTFTVVLHALNEIRMYGSFLKFHQMRPGFGDLLVDVLHKNKNQHVRIVGQDVHWRSVHRRYGSADARHPHIFQPHIQPEDIAYRRAEAVLYRLEPALEFWHNMDYVGWPQASGPISFNLIDNIINLVNDLPYERRFSSHLEQAVWDELYARYLSHSSLEYQLIETLDRRVVSEPVLADLEFAF